MRRTYVNVYFFKNSYIISRNIFLEKRKTTNKNEKTIKLQLQMHKLYNRNEQYNERRKKRNILRGRK